MIPRLPLTFAFSFFVIALMCGTLGFGTITGSGAIIGKSLFAVFLVLAAVALYRSLRS